MTSLIIPSRPDRMFLVDLSLRSDWRKHVVVAAVNRAAGPLVHHPGNQCLPPSGPGAHCAGPQGRPRFPPGFLGVPAKDSRRTPEHDADSRHKHKFTSVYGSDHRPYDLRRGSFLFSLNLTIIRLT